MVQYWLEEKNYFEVTKCFKNVFNTKVVMEDKEKWLPVGKLTNKYVSSHGEQWN
jgi:hypothetical protein